MSAPPRTQCTLWNVFVVSRLLKDNCMRSCHHTDQVGDWGLARSYHDNQRKHTPTVITLWYRPPEVLLRTTRVSPLRVVCLRVTPLFSRSLVLAASCRRPTLELSSMRYVEASSKSGFDHFDSTALLWTCGPSGVSLPSCYTRARFYLEHKKRSS